MPKPETLLCPKPAGLYCAAGDFYIDPVRPVDRAVITHGHSDHARAGHGAVVATAQTLAIMAARYGEDFAGAAEAVKYGQTVERDGVQITLVPAGHILGSAQAVIRAKGMTFVVSGDYKRRRDPTCPPFEPVPCDVFITEATFGIPVFNFPDASDETARLLKSVKQFPERTHLVGAYALGKAQRIVRLLREAGYDAPVYMHGAMQTLNTLYARFGVDLGPLAPATMEKGAKKDFAGAIVIAPPSSIDDKWSRRFADPLPAFASGWMRVRARARQRQVELPLVISDHADWSELTETISEIAPGEVWVTHGGEDALLRWWELKGQKARALSLVGYDADEGRSMKAFANLLDRLAFTPQRNGKLTLVRDFLREQPDPERGWVLASLTGALSFDAAKPGFIRKAVEARMDPQLFALSYDYVGDLAETVSLVWPAKPGANREPDLSEVVDALRGATRPQVQKLLEGWLDALDADGRWALLKLLTGGLRVGVSARLAKQACADMGGVEVSEIEEIWHGLEPPYEDLFAWLEKRSEKPSADHPGRFRPAMLAQAIDENKDFANYAASDYAAEWKWDGIRVQAVNERGQRRLFSRTGDDIGASFPDVLEALSQEGVIDGELLVMKNGKVDSFGDLQQRLNRKKVDFELLAKYPAGIRAYDILLDGEKDMRGLSFRERRAALEKFVSREKTERIDLSPLQPFESWGELAHLRAHPPEGDPQIAEGLMLKRWDSVYEAGRPKGPWFKWKRDPHLIDAVLMYAQRGHGKRSGFYSDYTFGVWREDSNGDRALTPVGKAYFGFTDEELKQIDKFVRDNTIERFGPVRSIKANKDFGLVLEVAFEGLQRSTRHKSGVAMRFPRINRIRWDKPAREADELSTLEKMLD